MNKLFGYEKKPKLTGFFVKELNVNFNYSVYEGHTHDQLPPWSGQSRELHQEDYFFRGNSSYRYRSSLIKEKL